MLKIRFRKWLKKIKYKIKIKNYSRPHNSRKNTKNENCPKNQHDFSKSNKLIKYTK